MIESRRHARFVDLAALVLLFALVLAADVADEWRALVLFLIAILLILVSIALRALASRS
jgi:hypothetical protein